VTATTNPPLTRRGIPVDRDLRILALGSFANRFGAGAVLTTSALYFTRQVGFSATDVGLRDRRHRRAGARGAPR